MMAGSILSSLCWAIHKPAETLCEFLVKLEIRRLYFPDGELEMPHWYFFNVEALLLNENRVVYQQTPATSSEYTHARVTKSREGWGAYIKCRDGSFPADKLYVRAGVSFCESSKFLQIHVRTAWYAACMNLENICAVSFVRQLHIEQPIKTT